MEAKPFTSSLNVCSEACCRKGWGRALFKDDVIVILLDFLNNKAKNAIFGPKKLVHKRHCTETSKHIYSQKWNCATSFPIYTCVYLCAIYILPRLVLERPIVGVYKSLTDTWRLKLGDRLLSLCFGNSEVLQFHFWKYLNWNQKFILDSHLPFIWNRLQFIFHWKGWPCSLCWAIEEGRAASKSPH